MKALRILIVEDEMIIASKISMHLEQMGFIVEGILTKGEEVALHCQASTPDILLLDINLRGYIDGIQTAEELQKKGIDIPIIYLTANDDDQTFERAKHTRPYAFISKPYKKQDLKRVLDLAIARMRGKEETIDIDKHQENEDTQILSDRIFIKQSERMVKVYLKDILFVEAERSYCRIITANNKYLLSVPLKKIAKKLCEDQFIRVHRSFIINLDEVDEVLNSHTILSKHLIPLGKSYRNDFLKRFQSL